MPKSKAKILTAFLLLTILLLIKEAYAHNVTVPTIWHFGFGTGSYINFNAQKIFNNITQENGYWYFDGYGFQVQNANMTITDLFASNPNTLKYTLSADSGTSTSKIYLGNKGEPYDIAGAQSYSYNDSTKILTVEAEHASPAEITVSWASYPGGGSVASVDWYFWKAQHTVNGVTGYVVNATLGTQAQSVSGSVGGNVTVYWGWRVWQVKSNNASVELSPGTPIGIISRNNATDGLFTTTWTPPSTRLNIGFDALKFVLYMRFDLGEWTPKAIFVSDRLLKKTLTDETWTIQLYLYRSYSGGVTSAYTWWGTAAYKSGIADITFTDPSAFEIMLYNLQTMNFIGFITYPYTYLIGNLFYGLVVLILCVPLALKYNSWKPMLVTFVLFGGAGGVFTLMVPSEAYVIVWGALLFVLAGLLYQVFR